MTKQERIKRLSEAIEAVPEEKKDYILGIAEGMAVMKRLEKEKFEDMTPEEQRKYLDKMNRQTEGISLAALALSFVSLVILVIKKRLGL